MNKMQKKKNGLEGAEYGLDSRYSSKSERLSESKALMEARLKRMQSLTEDQLIKARLLQLKLRMEEFITQPVSMDHNFFTEFLKFYIDTIYSKRKKFAEDIDETPGLLSKVLNNHREPKKDFMLKLMIHSEKTYKNICAFQKSTWYQVYYHEQIHDTISNQAEWRPKIERHVKVSRSIGA